MSVHISGPMNFKGKVALVSGAARGIGQAVCRALAREGADVACLDLLDCGQTAEMVRQLGSKALNMKCDVSSREQVRQSVQVACDEWGCLDIMVGSHGVLGESTKRLAEIGQEDWDQALDINLGGAFNLLQAVWPHMLAARPGKIVLMGSIAGRIGGVLAGPAYCASKGGIHALVKWAAKHGASQGILVNGVAPGPTVTPMTEGEPYRDDMSPLGRLGQPEDIAEAVLFLASGSSNYITGNVLDVNGGILMV